MLQSFNQVNAYPFRYERGGGGREYPQYPDGHGTAQCFRARSAAILDIDSLSSVRSTRGIVFSPTHPRIVFRTKTHCRGDLFGKVELAYPPFAEDIVEHVYIVASPLLPLPQTYFSGFTFFSGRTRNRSEERPNSGRRSWKRFRERRPCWSERRRTSRNSEGPSAPRRPPTLR